MDPVTFKRVDEAVDSLADNLDKLLESAAFVEVRNSLRRLGDAAGKAFCVSLECVVTVADAKGERSLPVLTTGWSAFLGSEPYRTWSDSSPQRYIVDGDLRVVPHDRCPKCWELWNFKFEHRTCDHCGSELGRNVKVLLDSDVCPHCEKGRVASDALQCSKCGYRVDPSTVTWG